LSGIEPDPIKLSRGGARIDGKIIINDFAEELQIPDMIERSKTIGTPECHPR
jgi:hypothetical protein